MKEENYDLILSLEDTNWWYKARRDLLTKILRSLNRKFDKCLDLGCGVGSNFRVLQEFSKEVYGIDYSKTAVNYSNRHKYKNLEQMDATKLKFKENKRDL